jgi:hypothetical protein
MGIYDICRSSRAPIVSGRFRALFDDKVSEF